MFFGLAALAGRTRAQTAESESSIQSLKNMSIEQLMNLDVTSVARHSQKLLDAPSAIQVVTGDDIEESGASSIPEALRLADNLDVAQKNSHDWGISARGFNTDLANKLLVMIDGRTVYTPLFSGVFWDEQDYLLKDIDRIEVISGPGGTQWGANAVNGVINITTKNAKDTQGLYAEGGGGTELRDFAGVRYGGTLAPGVYFRIYGKYADHGDQVLANGASATDSWSKAQGGFRIDSEASPDNTFTLQGDAYGGHDNLQTGGQDRTNGGNVLGRWVRTFSDESDLHLQLYYDRTHLTDPVSAFMLGKLVIAPPGTLKDDLSTYDLDFQHRFPLGEYNRILWGLGYRFTDDEVVNAPALAFFPATLEQRLFSGFAQDEIALGQDWSFIAGSKFEHNDYTGFEAEPNARLKWNVGPARMLWAAISRAVRTPSRIDRDLSEPAPPHIVVLRGDANFTSESVMAYEAGYRTQLWSKFTASLSTFYNYYDNVRSTSTTPKTVLPFYFANNLEGETYGAEFSGTYQVAGNWRLHAGYDLLKEHLRIKPGETDLNDALNETSDPEQQWSLRSSLDLPQNVELDTTLRWVGTLHNNNGPTPGTVPSYFELDARLGWQATQNLELSVVGENLLHHHHPEYGFPGPTREEILRSVYGKAEWRY